MQHGQSAAPLEMQPHGPAPSAPPMQHQQPYHHPPASMQPYQGHPYQGQPHAQPQQFQPQPYHAPYGPPQMVMGHPPGQGYPHIQPQPPAPAQPGRIRVEYLEGECCACCCCLGDRQPSEKGSVKLILDGKPLGKLTQGTSSTYSAEAGLRKVEVESSAVGGFYNKLFRNTPERSFQLAPGEEMLLTVGWEKRGGSSWHVFIH
ncbi:hypothetical protein DIPPA_29488 [Diplonema papillatum]|nr:hypothetical protein DIPPA_29488 [Diplonema papillatum]